MTELPDTSSPTVALLHEALEDAGLRDAFRRAYAPDAPPEGEKNCGETALCDRPANRKEAIFNSW